MTPFGTYKTYIALKSHFNTDAYDIFKYRGAVSANKASFEKRKDKYRLEKLSEKLSDEEIVHLFVANFIQQPGYSGLWDDQSERRYLEWKRYRHALQYNYSNEVKRMFQYAAEKDISFENVFVNPDGHPLVLLAYMGNEISIDTFVILNRIYSFVGKLDNNIVTADIIRLTTKYDPFVQVDLEEYEHITRAAVDAAYL